MSTEFAEKIIDSMVDENGHCGERGLSEKQFEAIVYGCSTMLRGPERDAGGWEGDYAYRPFWECDWEGTVGKYQVKLNEFHHFHGRYTVTEINLRPADEIERENRLRELAKFEHSEWVGEPKKRTDMELTLVREHSYTRPAYTYGTETVHIYEMADDQGNCYVWKTTGYLDIEWYDEDDKWHCETAEPGDRVTLRATVKAHEEWKGIKQTVITRATVKKVDKAA